MFTSKLTSVCQQNDVKSMPIYSQGEFTPLMRSVIYPSREPCTPKKIQGARYYIRSCMCVFLL
jgi:hypothetical protein